MNIYAVRENFFDGAENTTYFSSLEGAKHYIHERAEEEKNQFTKGYEDEEGSGLETYDYLSDESFWKIVENRYGPFDMYRIEDRERDEELYRIEIEKIYVRP